MMRSTDLRLSNPELRALTKWLQRKTKEAVQLTKDELEMKIRGRKRRSSKRKIGTKVVVLMSHFLSLILQLGNLPKE